MRRPTAAVGSAAFFLVGPGVFVGLIPWLLTRWQVREPLPYWAPMRVLGGVLLVAGLIVVIQAFARFVVEGFGTPVPVAAPERLVVGGVYRYVRNPMYVWRYWRPLSVRRCSWASSVCCCTLQPSG
jgi:protein-S-isoprenylcysteine O-methyltransferase Ste14